MENDLIIFLEIKFSADCFRWNVVFIYTENGFDSGNYKTTNSLPNRAFFER